MKETVVLKCVNKIIATDLIDDNKITEKESPGWKMLVEDIVKRLNENRRRSKKVII